MKQKRGAFRCCRWHNADELNYKQHLKMMKSTQEDCISYSRKGKHINESERQPLIEKLKEQVWLLLNDAPPVFQKLGKTLRLWFVPIIRMWRFTKSNGITEGFHRKMKLIQRRGFGYRNFQNYRLRVLIECGRILV